MSELKSTRSAERGFHWHLLTTVSALALLASVNMRDAKAADQDADRPTMWIELDGQTEQVGGQGEPFAPGFLAANPDSPVLKPVSPLQAQNPVPFSFAEGGKISFQPKDSDWMFSGAVNFGRSSDFKHVDHQTHGIFHITYKSGVIKYPSKKPRTQADFADTQAHHSESHAILDFSVGKDVGLGLFGKDASSFLSLGVRFAQFASRATFDVRARPDLQFYDLTLTKLGIPGVDFHLPHFHSYHATGQASRSFHGIGPSVSLNASAPVAGNPQVGEVIFDWGANAAVLFGRQKAHVRHQESARYQAPLCIIGGCPSPYAVVYQHPVGGHSGVRTVTVPNVGGFAGASYRIENFKVSLGYRADFFFGAMDGGIDAAKKENVGFYGPFMSVSVGLGG